jgi:chorismate mutase
MSERFDTIRGSIDATDAAIVDLVNQRLRLVAELWELKRELGLDRVDPGREASLRAALASHNPGPLSEDGLERLISSLLDLTKSEMRERLSDEARRG